MSKKHKIQTILPLVIYAVVIVLQIIDGNFSAVCGWICAAVWFAMARWHFAKARWHEDRSDKFHKSWVRAVNTNFRLLGRVDELKTEIERYKAKIRELETEDVDDGK